MPEEDQWVEVAMSQDNLVVDMLLKLKQEQPKLPFLRFHWKIRQRRSKSNTNRSSSPTTPLSWSPTTTSPPAPTPPLLRPTSKAVVATNTRTIRGPRKKKTLAELREEESLLQKERTNLNEQLITLRLNLEKQKAANSSLKKLKLDLSSQHTVETLPASIMRGEPKLNQSQQIMEPSDPSCLILSTSVALSSPISQGALPHRLPDLNIPADEDYSCSSFLYGLS